MFRFNSRGKFVMSGTTSGSGKGDLRFIIFIVIDSRMRQDDEGQVQVSEVIVILVSVLLLTSHVVDDVFVLSLSSLQPPFDFE